MNIENVYNKFEEIKNVSGSISKKVLLRQNSTDEDFIYVLEFIYNPFKKTGIANKKLDKNINATIIHDLKDLKEAIEYVIKNNTGTDVVVASLQRFIEKNKEHEQFLKEVFTKTYKCGLNVTTINSVVKDLIPTFGVMLATKIEDCSKELKGNPKVVATLKLDGFRCTFIKSHGKAYSRQGIEIEGLVELAKDFEKLPNGVYDGELIAKGDFKEAKDQYKETSKIARKKGDKKGLKFVCFDYMPEESFFKGICFTPCIVRKTSLKELIDMLDCENIECAEILYHGRYDEEKIMQLANEVTAKGEEGLMLNLADAPYECKRTKSLMKIKKFHTCDLKVIDCLEGNGEMKGMLGSFVVEYKNNKVNVGSGLTQAERIEYWNKKEELIGRVIEVGYREETQNEDGGLSLRFPTFKALREEGKEISYN